ncbi:hypothetical protein MAPG_10809 [Magnaporthiopsis poae ATCC 64411]|uniref:Uncharacterized protein n=1 Tax=Magnaporthiopsis poae (strain ATCC 64411 / 73-15) TaxID=644358 RepID=A0A0C4EDK7_MAGP6|nr:hypothetical protein MAPG_10809 [Magnaporthiopsis poae ATCC 64411]
MDPTPMPYCRICLFPISYFLFPISYFLFLISCFLFPISYFLFPAHVAFAWVGCKKRRQPDKGWGHRPPHFGPSSDARVAEPHQRTQQAESESSPLANPLAKKKRILFHHFLTGAFGVCITTRRLGLSARGFWGELSPTTCISSLIIAGGAFRFRFPQKMTVHKLSLLSFCDGPRAGRGQAAGKVGKQDRVRAQRRRDLGSACVFGRIQALGGGNPEPHQILGSLFLCPDAVAAAKRVSR